MTKSSETRPSETKSADTKPPATYEQARAELEDVVRRLETGGVPLEESLALWERGEELARQCQDWLDGARRRLEAAREQATEGPPAESPPAESPAAEE